MAETTAGEPASARILDVELNEPLPALAACDPVTHRTYARAQVLVRLDTRPVGMVDIALPAGAVAPDALGRMIWSACGAAINHRLRADGRPTLTTLTSAGIAERAAALVPDQRARFLADAPMASVVVCTRDRTDQLANCLPSLVALAYPHCEIIVVDNAPTTDATAALVRSRYGAEERVRYVREERAGLSWARNRGLALAKGEIVAFTDDDVQADPHWLAELARPFASSPEIACVTGLTLPAELETPAQLWYQEFAGFNKGRGFAPLTFNATTHQRPDPLYPYLAAQFGAGVNMAFRTVALRALGGFDLALGMQGEDIDAFFRVITGGYTLVYEPAALLRHFDRRDMAGLRRQMHRYGVSFTAFLTKCVVSNPMRALELVRLAPHAVRYLITPTSERNRYKRSYPHALTRAELRGMLYGPVSYARSRRQTRLTLASSRPVPYCGEK